MTDNQLEGVKIGRALELKPQWLAQVEEEIVDPGRVIIDTHHHLWPKGGLIEYSLEDLWADTGSGHNVVKTVFMECHAAYRTEGPEHLRSLGEVDYVTALAERSARDAAGRAVIAAMVTSFDLTRGDAVEELVHLHEQASHGLFRGIRQPLACARRRGHSARGRRAQGPVPASGLPPRHAGIGPHGPQLRQLALFLPEPRVLRAGARGSRDHDGA